MSKMTSEILKFADSSTTQKFKYLEKETLFFYLNKKILLLHAQGCNTEKMVF